MIKLQETFVSGDGGFSANPLTYTQLKRNEKAAVYMRSRDGKPYDYETFLIKIKPKGTRIFQKVLEDDEECYPSTSQWGRIAWSFTSVGMAMHRFHELTHGKIKEDTTTPEEIEKNADSSHAPISSVTPPTPENNDSEEDSEDDKPYKGPDLIIPVGEFSTKELAAKNNVQYPIAFLFLKDREKKGKIKFVRKERRAAKGKPTSLFQANNTP